MAMSGSLFSRSWSLDRKEFWIWVVGLFAAKVALVVLWELNPELINSTKALDTPLMALIAVVVGARFASIGWRRWIGITITAVIVFVLPLVLLFTVAFPNQPPGSMPSNPLDAMPWYVGWSSTACLWLLFVVAGTRPAKTDAALPAGPAASHQ